MLPATSPDMKTKATETQVLQALTSLAGLPSRQADDAEMDRRMYFVALEGVSRYALGEAVKSIIRGALGHTFFPSPVELRQQCDKAMEPHVRHAQRVRLSEQQARENAEFDRVRAQRTPDAIASQQEAYRRFCQGYEAEKAPAYDPLLDPELVAKIPDAPGTFTKARVA